MRQDPYQEVPLGYAQELGLFPNAMGNHERFLRECVLVTFHFRRAFCVQHEEQC